MLLEASWLYSNWVFCLFICGVIWMWIGADHWASDTKVMFRATVFFQLNAASLIATELACVPLARVLIRITNLWVPMMWAVVLIALGACLIFVLPETLHLRKRAIHSSSNTSFLQEVMDGRWRKMTFSKKNWSILLEKLEESRFVFTKSKLLALSISFLVQSSPEYLNQFVMQLASKRLHWTLVDVCNFCFSILVSITYWH